MLGSPPLKCSTPAWGWRSSTFTSRMAFLDLLLSTQRCRVSANSHCGLGGGTLTSFVFASRTQTPRALRHFRGASSTRRTLPHRIRLDRRRPKTIHSTEVLDLLATASLGSLKRLSFGNSH